MEFLLFQFWCYEYILGSRYVEVVPSACLEPNTNYTIRLDFRRYKSGLSTPDATALIDSVGFFSFW